MSDKTVLETLPCTSCKAECCGPVVINEQLLSRIEKFASQMDPAERLRLHNQERDKLTCHLLDVEKNRCAIYEMRPGLCRVFGRTPKLKCPKGDAPSFPETLVELMVDVDTSSPMAMLSTDFAWIRDSNPEPR
jgi:uncharacterized protein